MGAWGYRALDNDTAADWFDGLFDKNFYRKVSKALNSEDAAQIRAAALILERVGQNFIYDVNEREAQLPLAIRKLEELLTHKDYIDDWKEPETLKKEIRAQIKALKKL